MKIAYFSPFSPKRSGISDYSEDLLKYMQQKAEIDLWMDGYTPSSFFIQSRFKQFDYVRNPDLLRQLPNYDSILYNIGNNSSYHSEMYDVFLENNGIVILHDYVLFYLIKGYYLEKRKSQDHFLEEMKYNFGEKGLEEGLKIINSDTHSLQSIQPEKYPLNARLIKTAKGIIVHSHYTMELVKKMVPNANCLKVNQLAPEFTSYENKSKDYALWTRKRYGVKEKEIMLASFGFVAPTKRIHKVLEALSKIKNKNYKYVIVGSGNYVTKLVNQYKLSDKVIFTEFLSLKEFDNLMYASDIVINLRYPYMGETSASAIRALAFGKALIVSDIGWFSELPDHVVSKVPIDEKEVPVLVHTLENLIRNPTLRKYFGKNAKRYSANELNGDHISNQIMDFLHETKGK